MRLSQHLAIHGRKAARLAPVRGLALGAALAAAPGLTSAQEAAPTEARPAAPEAAPADAPKVDAPKVDAPKVDAPPTDAAPAVPKVLVLPYQPVFRSIPQEKAQKATDELNRELATRSTLSAVRGAVAEAGAAQASAAEIEAARAEAAKLEGEKRMVEAVEARARALAVMERNASALASDADFVLAHHHLARAQFWAGRDDDARATIEVAARMAPAFELAPAEFPRIHRRWAAELARKVLDEKPGELMVRSVLPGARISLDGRPMDVAPVHLTRAVPGKHLLGALAEGVPPYRTVVQIPSAKKAEVTVNFGGIVGGDAIGEVADALATNSLPRRAVERAAAAGASVGAAFVVLGALDSDENHINVFTYVVDVARSLAVAVEKVEFDTDMLTAESDVLRVVVAVEAAVQKFEGGQPELARLSKGAREQRIVNEVSAAASLKAEPRGPARGADGKKEVRKVFGPLKGGTIEIKD